CREGGGEIGGRGLADGGVKVLVNSEVRLIDTDGVIVHDRRIYARTVLWAAGVAASPATKWLNSEADKAGRVKVQPDLSVARLPDVYVIGDTALANCWKGEPVPGLAPAAKQGGAFIAKVIRAKLHGEPVPQAFSYRHMGILATIGRKSAVADFGFVRLRGAMGLVALGHRPCAFPSRITQPRGGGPELDLVLHNVPRLDATHLRLNPTSP